MGGDAGGRGRHPPAPEEIALPVDGRGPRVLVVEDEFVMALEIADLVAAAGYQVCGRVTDGPGAILAAELYRPDLILMDVRLSGGSDGVAAAREIRDRFGIGCVFLTADADRDTADRARAAAPLAFLGKPFTRHELALVLERLLDHPGRMN